MITHTEDCRNCTNFGVTAFVTEPLHHVLEKSVFERGLKRARLGVADSKSGTDFELGGAMSFNIMSAAPLERPAYGV